MKRLPLISILLIAAFLRFYNLMHDSPYFFNPDERNMAGAITQFSLPLKINAILNCLSSQLDSRGYTLIPNCNLNPHFFAYGQFPLYLAYFSDQTIKILSGQLNTNHQTLNTSFPSAIFYLRFWSALSSILTVFLVYLITRFLNLNSKFSILAALLATFTPGLIQSAHFGTTESLLTFFFLASLYSSIMFLNQPFYNSLQRLIIHNSIFILLSSIILGLSLSTKLTGLFFFIPPFIALLIKITKTFQEKKKKWPLGLLAFCIIGLLVLAGSIAIYFFSSPYNFIDFNDFKNSVFGYEADVATGRYPAFYTRQFVNTTPLLFQIEKILPYTLGWPIFIFGILGLIIMATISKTLIIKVGGTSGRAPVSAEPRRLGGVSTNGEGNLGQDPLIKIVLFLSFLFYLIPNSFLFTKWTRFMTPVFPFFAIFAAYFIYRIFLLKPKSLFLNCIVVTVFTISLLPGLAFMPIYTHPDSRIQASIWIYNNIPNNSYILSETANVVDIPVSLMGDANGGDKRQDPSTKNYNIISFDFYHLDQNPLLFEELINHLKKADYILIPSRRIFANYMRLPEEYPLITKYYQLLFSGRLGFEKIKEISSFPQIELGNFWLTFPDEAAEETWSVFDHPTIKIYKKVKPLLQSDYEELFRSEKTKPNIPIL